MVGQVNKNITLIDKDKISEEPSKGAYYVLMRDRWFGVTEDDKVVLINNSPICNMNKCIVDKIVRKSFNNCTKAVFLKKAWFEIDPYDFCI